MEVNNFCYKSMSSVLPCNKKWDCGQRVGKQNKDDGQAASSYSSHFVSRRKAKKKALCEAKVGQCGRREVVQPESQQTNGKRKTDGLDKLAEFV